MSQGPEEREHGGGGSGGGAEGVDEIERANGAAHVLRATREVRHQKRKRAAHEHRGNEHQEERREANEGWRQRQGDATNAVEENKGKRPEDADQELDEREEQDDGSTGRFGDPPPAKLPRPRPNMKAVTTIVTDSTLMP